MKKITVNLRQVTDNSYDIIIGDNITEYLRKLLVTTPPAHSYAVITDSNVEVLYGKKIYDLLDSSLPVVELISFPAGEENKNRHYKEIIEDIMLGNNFGRDSAVIAVGGGVVGDLAGFVAATYCRGIPHIQVPTSLVACVDSSVGGKTAVDTPNGKNLIGAFHQPWMVLIDIDFLDTLPDRELQEGLAEVIKYGVISDPELFSLVEDNTEAVFNRDKELLTQIIERSCSIKANVVEKDEKESDLRKILNFGHTVGHVIENLSSYSISHGRAISAGMVVEGLISVKLGFMDKSDVLRIQELLRKCGLPTTTVPEIDTDQVLNAMKLDKKARKGAVEMTLPESIGKMKQTTSGYSIRVEDDLVKEVLNSLN